MATLIISAVILVISIALRFLLKPQKENSHTAQIVATYSPSFMLTLDLASLLGVFMTAVFLYEHLVNGQENIAPLTLGVFVLIESLVHICKRFRVTALEDHLLYNPGIGRTKKIPYQGMTLAYRSSDVKISSEGKGVATIPYLCSGYQEVLFELARQGVPNALGAFQPTQR